MHPRLNYRLTQGFALALGLACLPALNACTESESSASGPVSEPAIKTERPSDARDVITLGGEEYLQDHQGGLYQLNPNRRMLAMGAPTDSALKAIGKVAAANYSMYDGSGQVEIRVWECMNPGGKKEHQTGVACQVEPAFVLVGGGARTIYGGGGGLLTEARPWSGALETYVASSKSHVVSDPHNLVVYSIGMRLVGFTSTSLWYQTQMKSRSCSLAVAAPSVGVELDHSYWAVGGGGKANWTGAGNLLTSSWGFGDYSWIASSKDHKVSSPATITAWVIGVKKSIPGWGNLGMYWNEAGCTPGNYGGALSIFADLSGLAPGYVLTSPGAISHHQGAGRLLTGIFPDPSVRNRVWASSKDHVTGSAGRVCAYVMGVKKI